MHCLAFDDFCLRVCLSLRLRCACQAYMDLNFLKPDTDGQRTDAYLPLFLMMYVA